MDLGGIVRDAPLENALTILLLAGAALWPATSEADDEARCAHYTTERRAFFGDTHVHTSLSHDAWAFDTRITPEGAYRFARGEAMGLPPLDETGRGTRIIRIERPLDFAAVADHAEYFGAVVQCTLPDSANSTTP